MCLSGMRVLRRDVHGQFHELSFRGPGHGLAGNGTIPAVMADPHPLAKTSGMKIMELLEKNIRRGHCHAGRF